MHSKVIVRTGDIFVYSQFELLHKVSCRFMKIKISADLESEITKREIPTHKKIKHIIETIIKILVMMFTCSGGSGGSGSGTMFDIGNSI
jgi:hypothetical protein